MFFYVHFFFNQTRFSNPGLVYLCHSWCSCLVPHQYTPGRCGDRDSTASPMRSALSGSEWGSVHHQKTCKWSVVHNERANSAQEATQSDKKTKTKATTISFGYFVSRIFLNSCNELLSTSAVMVT